MSLAIWVDGDGVARLKDLDARRSRRLQKQTVENIPAERPAEAIFFRAGLIFCRRPIFYSRHRRLGAGLAGKQADAADFGA
ncbi:hypothetical protein, partial [Mesorhizobium sp.]|uniref:hypothetical protein n=1 Tax=Mesorhizobium sp. TaxID=1871066 RepID=UPI00257A1983